MAVALIDSAFADGSTLTLPGTIAANDLLVGLGFRASSSVEPTVGDNWKRRIGSNGSGTGLVAAGKLADGSDAFGTWTNATQVAALVFRHTNYLILGGISSVTTANTTSVIYNATTANSLLGSPHSQNSIFVGAAGTRVETTDVQTAPTGMTNISSVASGSSNGGKFAAHLTDGSTSSWSAQNVTIASSPWASVVLEIYDTGIPIASSGGGEHSHFSF